MNWYSWFPQAFNSPDKTKRRSVPLSSPRSGQPFSPRRDDFVVSYSVLRKDNNNLTFRCWDRLQTNNSIPLCNLLSTRICAALQNAIQSYWSSDHLDRTFSHWSNLTAENNEWTSLPHSNTILKICSIYHKPAVLSWFYSSWSSFKLPCKLNGESSGTNWTPFNN